MKIALCQLNIIQGNIEYNTGRIIEELRAAAANSAQLAIFPELAVVGYLPKDLLEYSSFIEKAAKAQDAIADAARQANIAVLVGNVQPNVFPGKKPLLNSAVLLAGSTAAEATYKKLLPTYDVFDELRYFEPCPPGHRSPLYEIGGADDRWRLGVSICEDIWNDREFWKDHRLYPEDPIEMLAADGARLIVNISSSPFVSGKPPHRMEMLRHTARRWSVPVILVNQVGGCDQVIFDGGSCVVLPDGSVPCLAGWFQEKTVYWETSQSGFAAGYADMLAASSDEVRSIFDALTLGLRDYMRKTGFQQVVVGNSGGIDSATVLTLATAALGKDKVISVSMSGPFTSAETRADSAAIAQRLGVKHLQVPIKDVNEAFRRVLDQDPAVVGALFDGNAETVCKIANENLQARIRGTILMWISNAIISPLALVLSTGNKSEIAAGYCTLYGDMAGGLALISDVPKTTVYKLARLMNQEMGGPIPQSILEREPTAELAPNQRDSDSLPPYAQLDEIVRLFVEERKGPEEIVSMDVAPEETVRRVVRMIENAEYKRAQAAPGLKVTSKAFGFGRRIPIARGR